MQLAIDQSALVGELALVASAAKAESAEERASLVCLKARDDGTLRLTVNHSECGLGSEVKARVDKPGAICLPAKRLLSLVSALEGEITIRIDLNDYVTVTAGCSRSRLPGEAANTFTELPVMPEHAVDVLAGTLARLLSRVSFAAARSGRLSRAEIPAVLVQFTADTLTCVATDGRRLAWAQAPVAANLPFDFLLPIEDMSSVKKVIENQECARVAADANHLFVAAGTRLLASCRLAGNFPDYRRIMPKFDMAPVEIDSAALRSAVARVLLFTDSGARLDPKMRFVLRAGELSVSAASAQGGEGEDAVARNYTGPEIALGFNPRYLREFLDAAPAGKLHAWIKDARTATEWRLAGDDTYRYIAVPMPLPKEGA